jgi:hypothetical protein
VRKGIIEEDIQLSNRTDAITAGAIDRHDRFYISKFMDKWLCPDATATRPSPVNATCPSPADIERCRHSQFGWCVMYELILESRVEIIEAFTSAVARGLEMCPILAKPQNTQ